MDKNNNPLINIENLHIHMDKRMDPMNFYHPEQGDIDCCETLECCDDCYDCDCRDCPGHPGCCCPRCDDEVEIDMEELVKDIQKDTHLPSAIIERVLAAESKILSKLGVVTMVNADAEVHVGEGGNDRDRQPEPKTTAENGTEEDAEAAAHEVAENVFLEIAGLMLGDLLKEICGSERTAAEDTAAKDTAAANEADAGAGTGKHTETEE